MLLYRVFPYLASAAPHEAGGALHTRRQGAGRIDNPSLYVILYASSEPAGAVAEVFGWRATWGTAMLAGMPKLPGSVQALATYEIDETKGAKLLCDLDDATELVRRRLRPSTVISRDRAVSQAWARRLFMRSSWCGVSWWSYYDSRWRSIGLWEQATLTLVHVEPLTLQHPSILTAAPLLKRRLRHA
ncbi:MAG: RES family NAD+ phosphorylase [Candidatus Eremiobacteraeota bacterium]|nr:RES family NAD+ phosphorylase [Candidatus Eremiobacteraeota bacterium]MBC5804520.1 RES family NAD+ phosphorylase [Candidatus Eremiobacteraeota bacterium]MBC5825109.1 RES family NAD+ phosphorylase [Candidatus Eremiobacteraeota bacterium]